MGYKKGGPVCGECVCVCVFGGEGGLRGHVKTIKLFYGLKGSKMAYNQY